MAYLTTERPEARSATADLPKSASNRCTLATINSDRRFRRKNIGRSTARIINRYLVGPNDAHGPGRSGTGFPNSYPLRDAGTGHVN
jgi:hypothetical protein